MNFDKVITIDPGREVNCDYCNEDFTDSPLSGGVLFGSYAACPRCTPKIIADAAAFGELSHIRATCPQGMSYSDWVRNHLR